MKEYIDFKHYRINYLFNILNQGIMCFLFLNLFLKENSNFFDFFLKILVWWIGSDLITKMPYVVLEEKREGTLEFLFSNLKRLEIFLLVKTISHLCSSFLTYLLLALLLFLAGIFSVTNFTFSFNYGDTLKAIWALLACAGYGYFFSGVALIYKKTSTIVNTFGYLLLLGQFTKFTGPVGVIMSVIPSTWISLQSSPFYLFVTAVFLTFFGLFSFSMFFKISLKTGNFWR